MANSHEQVPALVEGSAQRRVARAVAVVLGVFAIQAVIGVVGGVLIAIALLSAGGSPTGLEQGLVDLDSPAMHRLLLATEGILLLVCIVVGRRVGWSRTGVRLAGARRSAALLLPLLLVLPLSFALDPAVTVGDVFTRAPLGFVVPFSILVGLVEEFVFRGLLVGMLGGSRAPWFAALWSAGLFGGVHVLGADGMVTGSTVVLALAITMMLGIPFALVYLRTGSIAGPIAVHAVWDIAAISAQGLTPPTVRLVDGLATLGLAAVVGGAYAAWFWRSSPAAPDADAAPRAASLA
jgi:membrane protease YdiL (CAAX protease family)